MFRFCITRSVSNAPLRTSITVVRRELRRFYQRPSSYPHPRYATGPARMMETTSRGPAMSDKRRKKVKTDKADKAKGADDVLQTDIEQLLAKSKAEKSGNGEQQDATSQQKPSLPEPFTEIKVRISELSSTGDGLALSNDGDHVYVVPFTVPGDKVRVKIIRHFPKLSHTITDLLEVIDPGPQRNDSLIGCKYFGRCSGCQLQMMSYEDQLAHKKRIVEKAYANFSGLIPELIPAVDDTFPSPMQYGYRTKLTPHFTPTGRKRHGPREPLTEVPPIGFTMKNRRADMDIEDCPLGTDIVRRGLKSERTRVAENIGKFSKGATLLMRESTRRIPKDSTSNHGTAETINGVHLPTPQAGSESGDVIRTERDAYIEEKRCITDNNATSIEYIDDYIFMNKAGAFFQNNNSILSGFTAYIREHAMPKNNESDPTTTSTTITTPTTPPPQQTSPIKYLLDAYSGSGLFTITLSPLFKSSLGVDVSGDSIASARENARANALPNTGFAAADAATLFKDVPYPADQTLLVIDPPRKGCSEDFLRQLLAYGPRRVVYVSCNVHTQARDVAVMVQGDEKTGVRYEIESIRGFDFFPQTGHVEGVAILNKV